MVRRKSPPGPTFVLSRASFSSSGCVRQRRRTYRVLPSYWTFMMMIKAKNEEPGGGIFCVLGLGKTSRRARIRGGAAADLIRANSLAAQGCCIGLTKGGKHSILARYNYKMGQRGLALISYWALRRESLRASRYISKRVACYSIRGH